MGEAFSLRPFCSNCPLWPSLENNELMEVRSVEAIVKALNDAKVQYLIVGGLAVNAHGFVRLTRDLGSRYKSEKKERDFADCARF